jgi:hypothetical protein
VDPVTNGRGSRIAVDFSPKSKETVSKIYLCTFLDLENGFEGNIYIRIHVEGRHHTGPVFNFNFQSNKRGREREDVDAEGEPMPDCMQEK